MRNRRFIYLGSFLLAFSGLAWAQQAQRAEPRPSSSQEWRQIAPGLEHLQMLRGQKTEKVETGPWFINALRVDTAKMRFQIVHAMDEAIGLETVSEMAQRYGAVAGINGGFFQMNGRYKGDSVGALMINGRLFSEPYGKRTAIGFAPGDEMTQIAIGVLDWNGRLVVSELAPQSSVLAQTENKVAMLNGLNRPLGPDEMILYTPDFHRTLLMSADTGTHLVYIGGGQIYQPFLPPSEEIRIPCDGYILAAQGKAAEWTRKMLLPGAKVSLDQSFWPAEPEGRARWVDVKQIVAGGPRLLLKGSLDIRPEKEGFSPEFAETWHPRTALGRTLDGKALLLTVDGRQPNLSAGMSLEMLAKLLHELGAQDAANLDGGGSTTMYLQGKIVNSPSDKTGERPVSDAILLFPRVR